MWRFPDVIFMEVDMKIDNTYAAVILIEILYERGIVNETTYNNVVKEYKTQCEECNSHI